VDPGAPAKQELGSILKGEARDALVFTASNLLNKVGGFLLLPLYWQRLQPDDYGVIAVIAVIGAFQALFGNLCMDLAVTRFYYQWPEAYRRRNLGAIWMWNWLATLACGGLFLLIIRLFSGAIFPDVPFDPYLLLGITGNALAGLYTIPASAIRIQRLPWTFAAFNLASFAATSGLGLWYVLVRDEGLRGYLTSIILANLLMGVIGGLAMLRFSRPSLSAPGLRETMRFALPAIPSDLISTSGGILDRFLLNHFASLHTLGVYAVSLKFVDALTALHSSLKMAFGPFMMKRIADDREQGVRAVAAVIPYYLLPYFAAGIGLVLFIGPLVRLIDQPEYHDIVHWVPWLTGVGLITCMSFYYTNGMFLANRTDLLSIPAGVNLGVMAVSGLLLVSAFQLPGLMISRYLAEGSNLGVRVYMSQRVFPMPHRWSILVVLAALVGACGALTPYLTMDSIAVEIGVKAAVFVGFAGIGYAVVRARARLT
jgi:O-antigen/teichoic acid export membrane protein